MKFSARLVAVALGACVAALPALLPAREPDRAGAATRVQAKPAPAAPMSNARLDELIRRIDPGARGGPGFWQLTVQERTVLVVTDERADRMRVITPVAASDTLEPGRLVRLLQANFDSALDARYSIARGMLWSAFIHPLGSLGDAEFLSGLGQVVNLATSYGSSYSSGALVFQGGDRAELERRELIEQLLKKGFSL